MKIKRKLFQIITFLVIFLMLIFFIAAPLYRNSLQRKAVDKEIESLKSDIVELENKNKRFKEAISSLKDDSYIENKARSSFGLRKNGEKVAVIIDKKHGSDLENKNDSDSCFKSSNLGKWLNYFFKKNNLCK